MTILLFLILFVIAFYIQNIEARSFEKYQNSMDYRVFLQELGAKKNERYNTNEFYLDGVKVVVSMHRYGRGLPFYKEIAITIRIIKNKDLKLPNRIEGFCWYSDLALRKNYGFINHLPSSSLIKDDLRKLMTEISSKYYGSVQFETE